MPQARGDRLVRQSFREQLEHLHFARRQRLVERRPRRRIDPRSRRDEDRVAVDRPTRAPPRATSNSPATSIDAVRQLRAQARALGRRADEQHAHRSDVASGSIRRPLADGRPSARRRAAAQHAAASRVVPTRSPSSRSSSSSGDSTGVAVELEQHVADQHAGRRRRTAAR